MVKDSTPESSTARPGLATSIGKNTVFGAIAGVAQVATRLVTIPIVIAHLGLGGYGIWSIIMTTAAYMRFGSVGIKCAFQKYVAGATGDKDYETASRLLSTGCALMLALSLAGLIPIMVFSRQVAVATGVPSGFVSATAGAISVLAIIMVLSNVGAVYEAIVLGGHRIDLARKLTTCFTVAEAAAIVLVLRLGYGLLAMTWVMALSEIGFVFSCYLVSRQIVPEIRLRAAFLEKSALREVVRFAGSYQLVNLLEVLYGAIVPLALMRAFGPDAAGAYALVNRLVMAGMMLQNAFLLPVLSGGTMIYASGSTAKMRTFLDKAFKMTIGMTILPLGFISIFGANLVYAWTGQEPLYISTASKLLCLTALFNGFSMVQLVLYRVSGRAAMDSVRQLLRIVILGSIAACAGRIGFNGVLCGLAVTELIGAVFMMFALARTFHSFDAKAVIPDAARLTVASVMVLAFGALATRAPLPLAASPRLSATLKLAEAAVACLLMIWPALALTRSLTGLEKRTIISIFFPRFSGAGIAVGERNSG